MTLESEGECLTGSRLFLCNWTIQVRIGNGLSDGFEVESGTPQGGVISPVISNILVNGLFRERIWIFIICR